MRQAMQICLGEGCHRLVTHGRCPACAEKYRGQSSKNRPGDPFYSGSRWRAMRQARLLVNPLCERCEARGDVTAANEVHHVKPRVDFPELAYDITNTEALCKRCHSQATAQERREKR